MNIIIPYVDQVPYKVTTKDIVLDIPSQEVITEDNATIIANAVAYINIVSPEKAVYGVEDYEIAIQNLDLIKAKLKEGISDDIADWGINLKTVEIQDINPSATMQKAMEEQAAAERQRRATVTRAEGEKQAAILEADGRLEASKRDGQAQIVLADASREAIERVTRAISDKELPVMYLLGERYIGALENLSTSDNAKNIIFPADLPHAIKGLLNR
jgi:regulator of protease activity HflC (stomatin/prohibitin superfamily)